MKNEYIELSEEEIAALERRMEEEFEFNLDFENGKE